MTRRPRSAAPAALAQPLGLILACLVAFAPPVLAQKKADNAPLSGVVTRVIDGDTLLLQPAGKPPMEVRLRNIDAPESCQAWGPESKTALEEYALGKTAELRTSGRDSYGRVIGSLAIDGQDLGARMVSEGHAWSTRTKWDNGPLVKQERQAMALKRGLHATPGAVMPRHFRATTKCPPPPKA